MGERIIVSLTTWEKRIGNIPAVLDTIINQSLKPNLIVLNLAFDEQIPDNIQTYIDAKKIEVFRTSDTKVYKKLIPTLKRYPDDVVISIDDDWLYPKGMIADFIDLHQKYPNNPISGNRFVFSEMICHCGCASLTKAEYFQPFLEQIDDDVIQNCPCDDVVYTYFTNKAGHPYITSKELYFRNMIPYNQGSGYSENIAGEDTLADNLTFLIQHFGELPHFPNTYIDDPYMAQLLHHIHYQDKANSLQECAQKIHNTHAYKTGKLLLSPLNAIKNIIIK